MKLDTYLLIAEGRLKKEGEEGLKSFFKNTLNTTLKRFKEMRKLSLEYLIEIMLTPEEEKAIEELKAIEYINELF